MTDLSAEAAARWPSYGRVFRSCAVAVATLVAPVLLTVGAVLFAKPLRVVAEPLGRWTPLPNRLRLVIAALVWRRPRAALAGLFSTQIASELSDVATRVEAAGQLRNWLEGGACGRTLMQHMGGVPHVGTRRLFLRDALDEDV